MRKIVMALVALMTMTQMALAEVGDDGLHKAPWMRDTFKDLSDDLAEANSEGKRMVIMVEQRGCIYCTKMHEEVYPIPEIADYIEENFFVVQINMFGDIEVTDFDGEALAEKDMVRKWGVLFTPTVMFMPETIDEETTAARAAVTTMPGAFGRYTTFNMFNWVVEKGYDGDENFQKYHARKFAEQSQ